MDHIKAVIARRVKFIIEKQSFISFAFDTRKGKNLKRVNSIFPSKKRYQDKKLKIKDFLVDYFINVVEKIKGISEFDRDYAKSAYAKYFKRLIRDLHRKLKKKGLCNKFEEDTGIFWAYFTKMVNILVYDLVTHNELVKASEFRKIRWFIHVPVDSKIIRALKNRIHSIKNGKGKSSAITRKMNDIENFLKSYKQLSSIKDEKLYDQVQDSIRTVQNILGKPPIYIEDAYSLE